VDNSGKPMPLCKAIERNAADGDDYTDQLNADDTCL
jgi:hypothetical protein